MADSTDRLSFSQSLTTSDAEAIKHLEQALTGGEQWYIALLETIGLWSSADEARDGCVYHYLIDGEAFDWLLLAGRLCEAVDGLLPADEKDALLFYCKAPLRLDSKQVKKLIGSSKYNQYLNYFYGVTVEQALILTVQEEVYKERGAFSSCNGQDTDDEAYRRIYGATRSALLKRFRRERGYPQLRSISLTQLKEFTYWLFKYRLKECDKARVASDTRKALEQLKRQWSKRGFSGALVADELSAEHY